MDYRGLFDSNINLTFKTASKLLAKYPKSAMSFLKIAAHQAKAQKLREQDKDISVPPLLIVSTTEKCNLCCKECYSMNSCREQSEELSAERIDTLLDEVSDAGCSAVLLAGGEPLMSPDWIYSLGRHKEMLGLLFTNGTLFNDKWYAFFDENRNIIPLFSVEGSPEITDGRRGTGVFDKLTAAMSSLSQLKIPFGISVTTGSHNINEVISSEFAAPFIDLGCKLVVYVEYVSMGTCSELMPLSHGDKCRLVNYCKTVSEDDALYIVFPGNEEVYGGCLAAGRGFAHISSSGSLEPCPFAPFSDRNLKNTSFIDALRSPLLQALRAEANLLHEGVGGCSLRSKEAIIRKLIEE